MRLKETAALFISWGALAVSLWYAYYLGHRILIPVNELNNVGVKFVLPYFAAGLGVLGASLVLRMFWKPKQEWKAGHLKHDLPGRLLHTGLFLTVVIILKRTDLAWNDFERTGSFVVENLLCRLVLAVYFVSACYGAGKLFTENFLHQTRGQEYTDNFILYFFTGATLLALLSTLAGFLGLLNVIFALIVMTPLVFYVSQSIHRPIENLLGASRHLYATDRVRFSVYFIFAWLLTGAALFFVVLYGLFPGVLDSDVWAHYLHYYREVIRTGHLGPNELWYHFYLSKGAGLFFLTGVLSDVFSAQQVSLCFLFAASLILFRLCRLFTKEILPALASLVVLWSFYDGTFLKHHVVLMGYIAFLIWIVIRVFSNSGSPGRYRVSGILAAFYFGFYQPTTSPLIVCAFLVTAGVFYWFKICKVTHLFLITLVLSVMAGVFTALAINFFMTGLCEVVPIRFFWNIADTAKFLKTIGPSGISYFMHVNAGLRSDTNFFNPQWAELLFRIYPFANIFPLPIFFAGLASVGCRREWGGALKGALLILLIFVICAASFGQAIQLASLFRLCAFTVFFTTFFSFFILCSFLDVLPNFCRKIISVALLLLLSGEAFCLEANRIAPVHLNTVIHYARGQLSFADIMGELNLFFARSGQGIDAIIKFRRLIGPDQRILNMGFDSVPGHSFPGIGLVHEPSYTMGPDFEEIVFGPPEAAKEKLIKMRLNYFLINVQGSFFSGLAFSQLFSRGNLNRTFHVVSREGNYYLLSWRKIGQNDPLPEFLMSVFDLKRSSALAGASSDAFKRELFTEIKKNYEENPSCPFGERVGVLKEKVIETLAGHLSDSAAPAADQRIVENFFSVLERDLPNALNYAVFENVRTSGGKWNPVVADTIVSYIQFAVGDFYENIYGLALAQTLANPSLPYKDMYRSREVFRRSFNMKAAQ